MRQFTTPIIARNNSIDNKTGNNKPHGACWARWVFLSSNLIWFFLSPWPIYVWRNTGSVFGRTGEQVCGNSGGLGQHPRPFPVGPQTGSLHLSELCCLWLQRPQIPEGLHPSSQSGEGGHARGSAWWQGSEADLSPGTPSWALSFCGRLHSHRAVPGVYQRPGSKLPRS